MIKGKLTPRAVSAEYWRNREQFADLFNAVLFGGRQVIRPEELEDEDTDETSVFEHRKYMESLEQSRDSIKTWKRKVGLALFGIEGQENIHYGMPLRIMGYDYLAYKKQYDDKTASYRDKGGLKDSSEFLSGIKRTDKLLPVITVVVYYGQKPWDDVSSLHGMLDIPKELAGYVNDYRISVVEAGSGSLKFQNKNNKDLFGLLSIILSNSIPKDKAREETIRYGQEHSVDRNVVRTIAGITGSSIDSSIFEKEDVSMCTLFEEEREEGRREGRRDDIKNTVIALKAMDIAEEKIKKQLIKMYDLTPNEAEGFLEKGESA